jgi:hypothetical protein
MVAPKRLYVLAGAFAAAALISVVGYLIDHQSGGITGAEFTRDPNAPSEVGRTLAVEVSHDDLWLGAAVGLALASVAVLLVATFARRAKS